MLVSVVTSGVIVTGRGGPWISVAAAIGIGALAAMALRRLRGTTLAAPAMWGVASGLAIAAVEIVIQSSERVAPISISLWRYAAAVSTFCPLMAVLGAKRPQDRGWQWVVLSLWLILLVPAMQAVAARSALELELYGAWRMLLWALIAMGLLNNLPTRFAMPATVTAVGQTLLLAPYLLDRGARNEWRALGTLAIFAAACFAMVIARGRSRRLPGQNGRPVPWQSLNDRWFRFRDGWGAFWGLRILQRVNQTAELSGWPVRLEWTRGFVPMKSLLAEHTEPAVGQDTIAHIEQTLDSLLRRFERPNGA